MTEFLATLELHGTQTAAGALTILLRKVLQDGRELLVLSQQFPRLLVPDVKEPHEKPADCVHLVLQVVCHRTQVGHTCTAGSTHVNGLLLHRRQHTREQTAMS